MALLFSIYNYGINSRKHSANELILADKLLLEFKLIVENVTIRAKRLQVS